MRIFRSWPDVEPANPHVVDDVSKIMCDSSGRETYGQSVQRAAHGLPLIMLEWDIAADPWDVAVMMQSIALNPEEVVVAPYWLWPTSTGLSLPKMAHRIRDDSPVGYRWWRRADPFRTYFDAVGWGCIYFPQRVIDNAPWSEFAFGSADTVFSQWCEREGIPMRVAWGAWPTHLHFSADLLTSPDILL